MPSRLPLLLLLAAAVAAPAAAQEAAKPGPAVEVRAASLNDLLGAVQFLGDSTNQAEATKDGLDQIRNLIDEAKGLEGVDPKRPWGLAATVTPNVSDSPAVLMIPLADQEAFLDLLRGKLALDPRKLDGGAYELDVPNLPVPLFFRFTKDHVLVTVADAKNLDAKTVPDPARFFAVKQSSQVVAQLHLDRLPADVKKVVFAEWELQANDGMRRARPGESKAQTKLRQWLLEQTLPGIQMLLSDGGTLTLNLDLDTPGAKGVARLDARFTARPGSPLAKAIQALDGRPGLALPVPAGRKLFALDTKLGLPEAAKKSFGPVVDAVLAEAVQNAPADQRIALQVAFNALEPTLKSGELDLKLAVTAGEKPGTIEVFGALKTVHGVEVEKVARLAASVTPDSAAKFAFDTKTVDGVKLHAVTVKSPEMQAAFGTQTLHLGTSEGRLLFALEGSGAALETVAAAKPAPSAVYANDTAFATLAATLEKELPAAAVRKLYREAFGVELGADPGTGADAFNLRVAGGDALTARLTISGKTLKFVTMLDAEKKKAK